jgi:SHS2 domain-containing protein
VLEAIGAGDTGISYRWVEHTGELEVEIEAPTQESVFAEALRALAELLSADGHGDGVLREVKVEGRGRAALLREWLNELVYLAETENLVTDDLVRIDLSGRGLSATVHGRRRDPPISSRVRPTTAWRSSAPGRASMRGLCSMSELARASVH